MAFQTVFKRYELKYMLTLEQKAKVLAVNIILCEAQTSFRNSGHETELRQVANSVMLRINSVAFGKRCYALRKFML